MRFFASGFFHDQFPACPRVSNYDCFKFFWKFAEIFASQGALLQVSTTQVAYCQLYQRHRRQILPLVSLVMLKSVARCGHQWQNMEKISGWRLLKENLKTKNHIYVNSTTQNLKFFWLKIFPFATSAHRNVSLLWDGINQKTWVRDYRI